MLNLIDEFTRECLAIRVEPEAPTRPTSSTSCPICSSCAACPPTYGPTTARSSSPRRCGSGSQQSAPRPPTSSLAALGRTATARASTRNSATSCSTGRSSTASPRPRSSSRAGAAITILGARTHRWAIAPQPPQAIMSMACLCPCGSSTSRSAISARSKCCGDRREHCSA
jgi:hypothetical protein